MTPRVKPAGVDGADFRLQARRQARIAVLDCRLGRHLPEQYAGVHIAVEQGLRKPAESVMDVVRRHRYSDAIDISAPHAEFSVPIHARPSSAARAPDA